ncbi:MAG TPA: aspartyl-phosphate phosphatase Spo0E family protein [Thermoclostridium caenicola]|uniref:Spo0E like sporulation regulatory protein n=1 Tax=Thermoclostridium caenicola TaxID=659425 RepID=A0A1M6JM90_9FIRM|nr:aspartyl-phosphate phosphatase Spo0E family protein [Thermoclostridium caenicola]SHJ47760.1 Spo0E like sporulation regulatory protein [Thermoclostridium caenicola]HOK44227.1 aspartyl-phosphate phosphatase Spo0E family protein [Thermoclostridium caenicola]HOL84910.1 aspartyl-phosphate phosphatase Spo0E family protein [Thermoclostridium caenicola]HPO77822.1 aspartyl-phosphate phosphatase Spo0E family protein [Thermoclostridium caenicola]
MVGAGLLVKEPKELNSDDLQCLPQEIEKLKTELNLKVTQNFEKLNNKETLELSQRLDELIVNHLLNELASLRIWHKDAEEHRAHLPNCY